MVLQIFEKKTTIFFICSLQTNNLCQFLVKAGRSQLLKNTS